MKFDKNKHCFVAVDPKTREQLFVPLSELGQMVVKEVERIEINAPPADLGPLRKELSEKMGAVVLAMQQEFDKKLADMQEATLHEAERRFLLGLEAIAVVGRVQSNEPVDLDAVPALVNEVKASGVPVTEEAVIAAADRHAARIHQIAAGRA